MSGQRYKRTQFDDDELTSNGGTPPPMDYNASVVFKPGWLSWQRRSTQEKVLLVVLVLMAITLIVLASVLAVKDSTIKQLQQKKEEDGVCLTPECITIASSLLNTMDRDIKPCDDFYQYACGGWIKTHPIPSGHARWGTFGTMWQENQLVMKNAIEQSESSFASEAEKKARRYYLSCMDPNKTVDKLGAQPLLDLMPQFKVNLSHFDKPDDGWELQDMLERVQLYDISALFFVWVGEDDKNSSRNILQVDQDGLGLPQRDYYINKTMDDKVLSAYLKYMVTINNLLAPDRHPNLTDHLTEVILFEKELAKISIPAEERRDEEKIYHKMTLGDMNRRFPLINWKTFFNRLLADSSVSVDESEEVVVYAPEYLESLVNLTATMLQTLEGKRTVNLYLEWHIVKVLVPYLSKPFREAKKEFSEVLSGVSGREDEWRYCITDTDSVLGFALGALFVKNAFHGESKDTAEKMIDEVKAAFKNNLVYLTWMDDKTRKAAIEKANAVIDMIGFPKYILNVTQLDDEYKLLQINESEFFQNNIRNLKFILRKNMEKLRQAPKQNVWGMTPPTVNAYYTPSKNEIVFPAGILQAPFYDKNFPKSLNFGAMGVVMGHELTHGFDDQGREFDKNGNLRPWWNQAVIQRFEERTKCMVDQYSGYTLNGENVRGKQTLGENIADNGGLKSAFHAYKEWVEHNGDEQPLPALNMTHEQIFFLGFAQVWCSSSTKEADHLQILSDPHSPAKFRVIGTLSNSRDFANAWKCPAGTTMNPVKKCEVW